MFTRGVSTKSVAIVDIDGGSVGAGLVALGAEEPRVLSGIRRYLPLEERSGEAAVAALKQLLQEVAAHVFPPNPQGKSRPIPSIVYVVIRDPWTRSSTQTASVSFQRQERITDAQVLELSHKALAQEDALKQNMLEASVMRVELNGYPTASPGGEHAHHMAVTALIADCDPAMRAMIEETIPALFASHKPVLRSGARATMTVLRKQQPSLENYLLADVSAEGASFSVVREGAAREHIAVANGLRALLQQVASTTPPDETLAALRMAESDECSGPACEQIQQAAAKAEPELAKAFGEAFSKLNDPRRLPNDLILFSHHDVSAWLGRFFSRIDFTQFTTTTQPFRPHIFSPTAFARFEPGAQADLGLSFCAALVNIEAAGL